MLTKKDIETIRFVVREEVSEIKSDVSILKHDVNQIKKDLNRVIEYVDTCDIQLENRIIKMEKHLDLPTN